MKITFLGAAHEVTGSCTYLEVGDKPTSRCRWTPLRWISSC